VDGKIEQSRRALHLTMLKTFRSRFRAFCLKGAALVGGRRLEASGVKIIDLFPSDSDEDRDVHLRFGAYLVETVASRDQAEGSEMLRKLSTVYMGAFDYPMTGNRAFGLVMINPKLLTNTVEHIDWAIESIWQLLSDGRH
jgi:hypothetical protein